MPLDTTMAALMSLDCGRKKGLDIKQIKELSLVTKSPQNRATIRFCRLLDVFDGELKYLLRLNGGADSLR
ncbi:MAG: hypothetical protein ACREBC_30410 [Pyrinomonadaceae bacterium]